MGVVFKCTPQYFSFLCWPRAVCHECLLMRIQRFRRCFLGLHSQKSQILQIAPCAQREIKSCLAEADEKRLVASAPLFRKSALLLTPFFPFPSPVLNRHNNLDTHQMPLSVHIFDGTEYLWTQRACALGEVGLTADASRGSAAMSPSPSLAAPRPLGQGELSWLLLRRSVRAWRSPVRGDAKRGSAQRTSGRRQEPEKAGGTPHQDTAGRSEERGHQEPPALWSQLEDLCLQAVFPLR